MENLSQFYYEQLKTTTNPGSVLTQLYADLSEQEVDRSVTIMINKLIKVFGRFTVFFAIVSAGNTNLKGNPYPYLYAICRNKFEQNFDTLTSSSYVSLDRKITAMQKEIEKVKNQKLKIPDSTELGELDGK